MLIVLILVSGFMSPRNFEIFLLHSYILRIYQIDSLEDRFMLCQFHLLKDQESLQRTLSLIPERLNLIIDKL